MYIKKIVPLGTNKLSNNVTTRDNLFEALVDGDKIYILDKNNNLLEIKLLKNRYQLLTFNNNLKEYLMLSEKGKFKIINFNLEEVAEFKLSQPITSKVNDIFFDALKNHYLIAEDKKIYSVDSVGRYLKNEVNINDFYAIRYFDICGCKTSETIPHDFMFTAVGSDELGKYIAYNKNNSAYLAHVSDNGSKISEIFLGDNIKVNSIINNGGIFLNVTHGNDDYLYELSFTDGKEINPELEDIISNLNSLIDKIGITENQIANLINTEAMKVQKVIQESTDLDLLLQTNNSVSGVINALSIIEQGQRDNLALVMEDIMELEKYIQKN